MVAIWLKLRFGSAIYFSRQLASRFVQQCREAGVFLRQALLQRAGRKAQQ